MRRIRSISAVMRKEFTLLVRYPTWVIQMIIWPLIFPLLYVLSAIGYAGPDKSGLGAFAQITGTNNYVGYIVMGTMVWMWVNVTMWGFGTFLRQEQTLGTLESNWLCPIKKFDLLIGSALISMLSALLTIVISVIEYRFIYGVSFTGNIFSWILIFLIMLPGVYGLAIMFGSLVLWAKESNAAVNVVRGLMMILCGITFPIDVIPEWMQAISKCIPFTHGISAAREIMVYGHSITESYRSILLCLGVGLIYLILGRLSFGYTEAKVKSEGALGRY